MCLDVVPAPSPGVLSSVIDRTVSHAFHSAVKFIWGLNVRHLYKYHDSRSLGPSLQAVLL